MSSEHLQRTLTALVGATNVVAESAPYILAGRSPALVVAPAGVEELAQVVAACNAARVPIVPWGGGTRQGWGGPIKAESFVVVKTDRLNQVLIYEPDDLTISVEAGITLAALDAALAANGQMLPLDAPWPQRGTIGGILASGVDGPRRLGYGTARDLLIGIRVVEAGGRISKAGGMVVKNVSGFDMMKLYIGSLGSLAIIVSANFKLLPRPRATATIACHFGGPEAAFALAEAIRASYLTPAAVEYLEGWPVEGDAPQLTLLVRAEGLPAAVERHIRDLETMAAAAGALKVVGYPYPGHAFSWDNICDLAHPLEVAPNQLAVRLVCLPGDLPAALEASRALAAEHSLDLKIAARALSGVAYLRASGAEEALRTWYADLLARQPLLTLLAAPAALAAELPAWGRAPANLDLMRRIKQEFDPEGQLNPGRFVV